MTTNGHHGLAQQPPEILDRIVSLLGERQDLLSFGLTSKHLACVVFPRHFEYHTVSEPLHNISIWRHLIQNRACARNVRRVQVIHDSYEDHGSWGPTRFKVDEVPTTSELDEKSRGPSSVVQGMIDLDRWREGLFLQALGHMSNLRAFAWHRMCPPFISGGDDLWTTLQVKPLLVDIRLSENWYTPKYEGVVLKKFGVLSMLTCPVSTSLFGLTGFEFQARPGIIGAPINVDSILESLIHLCPSLETLIFGVYKPPPRCVVNAPILQRGRWPNLSKFQLRGLDILDQENSRFTMENFLTFHTKLSDLTLSSEGRGDFPHVSLPPNSLPNLTSIQVDEELLQTILDCPCSPQRKLHEIKSLRLDTEILEHSAEHFQGVDKNTLRSITVTDMRGPGDLEQLAALFPDVECLNVAVDFDASTWDEEAGTMRVILIAEWAEKISVFRNLRVLHGVPFFSDDHIETDDERAEVIGGVAMLFPKLEWFSVPHLYSRVDILRSAEGLKWRVA